MITDDWSDDGWRFCPQCRQEQFISEFGLNGEQRICRMCSNGNRVKWANQTILTKQRALKIRREYVTRRKEATGSHTRREWLELLGSFDNQCAYCQYQPKMGDKPLIKEHLVALSQGGYDDISNIVPACQSCNASKYNRRLALIKTNENDWVASNPHPRLFGLGNGL
jgi:5-methylcytosine-specific restriction endonuclease McrA